MPTQPSQLSADSVPAHFDRAAPRYDLMTALNPGYHRHLLRAARTLVAGLPTVQHERERPTVVLDVGCGSGSSTKALTTALAEQSRPARIVGVDASAGMLEQARKKRWPTDTSFVCASAESLADITEQDAGLAAADAVMAAYLFRNVGDPDDVASQMYRALSPGGVLVVHEYSVADSQRARRVWDLVCRGLVVPMSTVLRGHPHLYRYLHRSVIEFDGLATFCRRLTTAGFVDITVQATPGWQRGILHTIRARRAL